MEHPHETPDPLPPGDAGDSRENQDEGPGSQNDDTDAVDFFAEIRLGQEGVTEGVITFW